MWLLIPMKGAFQTLLPGVFACLLAVICLQVNAETKIPETLDLRQHAESASNALTCTVDDRGEFIVFFHLAPPSLIRDGFSFASSGPKYMESLAMMSVMTGADLKGSPGRKIIDYLLSCLGEDGLFYAKIGPDRPWDKSSPEDWANLYGQARMLRSMLAMYQLDRDPAWIARMRKLVGTLRAIAIRKTDPETGEVYAYYPTTPGYGDIFSYPKSGWKTTEMLTAAQATMADLPDHTFGIPLYLGGLIEPLTRYATMFNEPAALELAGQIVRLIMRKDMAWVPDGHARGVVPEQNGQFRGHFHAHTMCLRGILEYGIATDDMRLKNFARAGYEYARTFGIPRIGWFPEYTGKFSHETCGLANMVALAIKLSESGVGDYWDDVDGYARNHLTQAQCTDLDRLKTLNKEPLTDEQVQLLRRVVGCFGGWGTPTGLEPRIMNCCTANGSQALYYVWDSIILEKDGLITINLLLNRRSPWLDIESALPDRGEVVLRNRHAQRIAIRMPEWVDKSAVAVEAGKTKIPLVWIQNYLFLEKLKPGSNVRIAFPMREAKERYAVDSYEIRGTNYLGRQSYTVTFRGNTAVAVEPKASAGYAIYTGDEYRAKPLPGVATSDYIPTKRIRW